MKTDHRTQLLYYVCQAILLAITLNALLGLSHRDLSVPFVVEGDALHHVLSSKLIMDTGWWWHTDRLSAPFTFDMRAFPVGGTFDYLLLKVFTLFTNEPGLALNLCWLFTIFLTAGISTFCLTMLPVSPLVATVMGMLYALTPRTFYSNISAFPLTIYLLPPVIVTAVLLTSDRWADLSRRRQVVLLIGCFLSGLNYTYHSFFSVFLLSAAAFIGWLSVRRSAILKTGAVATGLIVIASMVHVAPTLLAWHADPATKDMMRRLKDTREADIYGLKLRQLVTPAEDHFLSPLRDVERRIAGGGWPHENENTASRLGTVATIGLIVLFLAGLVPAGNWLGPATPLIRSLSSSAFALILLAMVGGLGSMWNVFVSNDIRAYNRVSNYIAFLCVTAVGILFTQLLGDATPETPRGRMANVTWVGLLFLFGILDQNSTKYLNARCEADAEKYRAVKDFVGVIEPRFSRGSAIYQLPYVDYPATPPVHHMTINDPILAYVHSRSLRWSWPALSAEATAWNRGVSASPPDDMLTWLCRAGFDGIWIDRNGYADRTYEDSLSALLEQQPIVSANGRYAVYSLAARKKAIFQGKGPTETEAISRKARQGWIYEWGTTLYFDAKHPLEQAWSRGVGWGPQETPLFRWIYGKQCTLKFHVVPATRDQTLSLKVFQFLPYKRMPVIVKVDGTTVGTWNAVGSETFSLRIPAAVLAGKTRFTLTFDLPETTTPQAMGYVNDDRLLGLAVREIRIGD